MAAAVLERGGDDALCLKGNRSTLQRQARALLDADARAAAPAAVAGTLEEGHGRQERRTARGVPAEGLGHADGFPGVATVAEITGRRGAGAPKTRLYLLSVAIAPERALAVVRAHWSIENSLHGSLDVVIGEDRLRSRRDNAPANIAILNRCALNIARAIDDPKTPIRRRFKRCRREDDYLLNDLAQMRWPGPTAGGRFVPLPPYAEISSSAFRIAVVMPSVPTRVAPAPPMSRVRAPLSSAAAIALSSRSASATSPNE